MTFPEEEEDEEEEPEEDEEEEVEEIEEDIEDDEEVEGMDDEIAEKTTVYIQNQRTNKGVKLESEVDNCFGFDVSNS